MNRQRTWWLLAAVSLAVGFGSATIATADLGKDDPPGDLNVNGEIPLPETGLMDCDPGHVMCDQLPPLCFRAGTVPRVVDTCWGECVEFSQCAPIACAENAECPGGTTYCHAAGLCASDDVCDPDYPQSCPEELQLRLFLLNLL